MENTTTGLSALGQKIFNLLLKERDKTQFLAINKNQFDGESLDNFFLVLKELKSSGLVSFHQEYEYKPYESFGDMTTKQYGKMDILLKINEQ